MTLFDIADEFKKARLACRKTQREVASEAGVSWLTVSKLERGALSELGTVKLLALLQVVGLELVVKPIGHRRTLDDISQELDSQSFTAEPIHFAKRVRRSRKDS